MKDGFIHCPLCDAPFYGGWCFHDIGEYQIAYSIYGDIVKNNGYGFYIIKKGNKVFDIRDAGFFIPVWKPIRSEAELEKYLALK